MSTATFDGEIIFILVTRRSMMSNGKSNSPTIQSGMAPPQGLQLSSFLSIRNVSMPPLANVSAAEPPAGPPPTMATRRFRPDSLGLNLPAMTLSFRWGRVWGLVWPVKWIFSDDACRSPTKDLSAMEFIFDECECVTAPSSE